MSASLKMVPTSRACWWLQIVIPCLSNTQSGWLVFPNSIVWYCWNIFAFAQGKSLQNIGNSSFLLGRMTRTKNPRLKHCPNEHSLNLSLELLWAQQRKIKHSPPPTPPPKKTLFTLEYLTWISTSSSLKLGASPHVFPRPHHGAQDPAHGFHAGCQGLRSGGLARSQGWGWHDRQKVVGKPCKTMVGWGLCQWDTWFYPDLFPRDMGWYGFFWIFLSPVLEKDKKNKKRLTHMFFLFRSLLPQASWPYFTHSHGVIWWWVNLSRTIGMGDEHPALSLSLSIAIQGLYRAFSVWKRQSASIFDTVPTAIRFARPEFKYVSNISWIQMLKSFMKWWPSQQQT